MIFLPVFEGVKLLVDVLIGHPGQAEGLRVAPHEFRHRMRFLAQSSVNLTTSKVERDQI